MFGRKLRSSPTTIIVPASEPNGATQAATAEASIGTLWWQVQADGVKVYEIDFFGALASAETSEFQVSTGDVSTGGPNSEQRVGPAHLVLDDGATITIAPGTPGGNMCRAFGSYPGDANEVTCFVVGAFKPETTEAQWFALIPSFAGYLDVAGFGDRAAQFSMDDRSRFELPVRTDARLVGCPAGDLSATPMQVPEAAEFYASFNAADEVVVIECAADY